MTLLLALLACKPTPPTPLVESGGFSALSYNVAGLPEGLSSSHPEAYIPLISPLLNDYDLVLAQEDFAYHHLLEADAAHPYRSEPKVPEVQLVNDGLNRFSQFPFGELERVQWEDCYGFTDHASDCLAEKGFSLALTTLAPEIDLLVVNLHAEASSEPPDTEARRKNFEQLADHLASHVGPLLLAGDTNMRLSRPDDLITYTSFVEALDLTDACVALDCQDDHIDRFFFRSGSWTLEPVLWRVADEFVTSEGVDLSDHPAIHVDWEWRR